jgi:NAD(P)H-hydrate epimerase
MNTLSRDEVREFDRCAIEDYGVPGIVLMENAGRSAAEALRGLGATGPVCICCGKGNNGGDGFVIARHLNVHRVPVRVLLFAKPEELSGDAAINYQIISRSKLPIKIYSETKIDLESLSHELEGADWIVDALFGTGLSGPVRPPLDKVITAINASGRKVLAVDIPSGLDCDCGEPLGPTVKADHTVTFVAMKKGFVNPAATAWTGKVHVVYIGVCIPAPT